MKKIKNLQFYKTLINFFKENPKAYLSIAVFLIITMIYLLNRQIEFTLYILSFCIISILFCTFYLLKILEITIKIFHRFKYQLLCVGIIIYLVFSFFNSRTTSADGKVHYLKIILALKDKWYVNSTEFPNRSYIGEFLLSFIYKFAGLGFMNLVFGIFYILNCYLGYKLIKTLTSSKIIIWFATLFFIFSPTFLAFGFIELKIDLIATFFVLLSLNLFYKFTLHHKETFAYLVVITLGFGIITKPSNFFICVATFFALIYFVYKKKLYPHFFIKTATFFILLVLPSLLFYNIFGGSIPSFQNIAKFNSILHKDKVTLQRDTQILTICTKETFAVDYSDYIYGSASYLVLLQPFFYIFNYKAGYSGSQVLATPGILVYIGLVLSLFYPLTKRIKKESLYQKLVYLITSFATLMFLIFVSSVFWYVMPLFPIYLVLANKIIINEDRFKNSNVYKIITILIFSSILLYQLIYSAIPNIVGYERITDYSEEGLKNSNLLKDWKKDQELDAITKGNLILDASQHNLFLSYPFLKNWDSRVVISNYYFAASQRTFAEMSQELKSQNINFIMVSNNQFISKWYKGCPKQNNQILEKFLKENTTEVKTEYSFDKYKLYKLN